MASGSVWGLDLGKSSLKAVRMRRGKEELEVQALAYYEYTPADDGTIPPGEPSRALEQLIAEHPAIKKERALVALPGHASFNRFVKLPSVDPRKIGDMVRFEAQQQIPFPIAEVNWDYALVERDYEPDEDREVGLFAIKKDVVYGHLADLQLAGLAPDLITVEPLAIYNYIRWDMELPDQATVVVDIGWDHTDLVIVDGERYWIRNLALNGQDLTKAIATRMKVDFAEAERLKREAAATKEAKKLYQATEVVLKDFVGQIQQSIGFYKKLNKDRTVQIAQVLLLGSGSKLANIKPFFQKELGYPVEIVKKISHMALDVDVDVDLLKEHLPSYAVAFGLAIQGCGEGANAINLLPEEIQQQKALEKKKPLVAVAVGLLYVLVIVAYVLGRGSIDKIDAVLKVANNNLTGLKKNDADRKKETNVEPLEKQLKKLVAMTAGRNLPLELLNKLAGVLPKGDDALVQLDDGQKKVLQQQGGVIAKVAKVKDDVDAEQAKLNDEKTWVLDVKMKAEAANVHTTLLVARKLMKNAQGQLDEAATLKAIETGLLADVKRVLPSAQFEAEAPKQLSGLEKDAVVAAGGAGEPGGGFGAKKGDDQRYLSVKIVIDYPGTAGAAPTGDVAQQPPAGEEQPK
jgi:type IV pilus assembly protein PilM